MSSDIAQCISALRRDQASCKRTAQQSHRDGAVMSTPDMDALAEVIQQFDAQLRVLILSIMELCLEQGCVAPPDAAGRRFHAVALCERLGGRQHDEVLQTLTEVWENVGKPFSEADLGLIVTRVFDVGDLTAIQQILDLLPTPLASPRLQ